ncbi:MAG: hypothetical protein QOD68_590 [Actinomycetota bacterium]|nr:hypothetical protein [Actinomycetota bacterium]
MGAAAVLVVALVMGLVAVIAGTGGAPGDGSATADVRAAARDKAVRAVLSRRAHAVLHRDEKAWLADIDPQAHDFLSAQRTVFASLAQVDFASWRYELVGRDYDRPDLAGSYDVPYHLPAILLHYAIKGYDPGPVARPQALTFVLRGHRWRIASDSDADSDLPETGHADPWDRRAMVAREGEHVLVLADAADKGRLAALVRVSDAAVTKVARMWPTGWRRKVVVVAVRDQRLVETYFRTALQSSDKVAAIAVPAFDTVPGWTPEDATTYDQKTKAQVRSRVILNPRYFQPNDKDNAQLLTHEVTHVATQADTMPGAPAWLLEGIADYTAYRDLRPFAVTLPKTLRAQVDAGAVELPTYDFYQHDVAAHYLAGFLACAFVSDRYGEATLRRWYDQLATTPREIQTGAQTQKVTRKVLGLSTSQLSHEVAAYAEGIAR